MIRGHHLSGWRRPEKPVELTESQRAYKWLFCLIACAVCAMVAVWGFIWAAAAASHGVVSVLHFAAMLFGWLMAYVFGDIAERA
jgi:hypothetical protein